MSKRLITRIQNKYDYESNWNNATFSPLDGELIIYGSEVDENGKALTDITIPSGRDALTYSRIKIGDGKTPINELPFLKTGKEESLRLTGISIAKYPNKVDYYQGDIPDLSGIKVQAYYSDGTQKDVSDKIIFDSSPLMTLGKNIAIELSYTEDGTTVFTELYVNVNLKVVSIEVSIKDGLTNEYEVDQYIPVDDLKIMASYSNGTTDELTDAEKATVKFSPEKFTKKGNNIIVVTYNDASGEVTFSDVKPIFLDNITLVNTSYKYTGEQVYLEWYPQYENNIVKTHNIANTYVGTYTAKFVIENTDRYEWKRVQDTNIPSTIIYEWKIEPKLVTINVTNNDIELKESETDVVVEFYSSDPLEYAEVLIPDEYKTYLNCTFNLNKEGKNPYTHELIISRSETISTTSVVIDAVLEATPIEAPNYAMSDNPYLSITIYPVKEFAELTWNEIKQIITEGNAKNMFSIGDSKNIFIQNETLKFATLTATDQDEEYVLSFTKGDSYSAPKYYIVMSHGEYNETTGVIVEGTSKKYEIHFSAKIVHIEDDRVYFMIHGNTMRDGMCLAQNWPYFDSKGDFVNQPDFVPGNSSWVNNYLLANILSVVANSLPTELKNSMSVLHSSGDTNYYLTLPSVYEIYGKEPDGITDSSILIEYGEKQFDYFSQGNNKEARAYLRQLPNPNRDTDSGKACDYVWLRTQYDNGGEYYQFAINQDSSFNHTLVVRDLFNMNNAPHNQTTRCYGLMPIFCIAAEGDK